jgi:tRNA (guanosine-2'-O-)-methyltransferase
MGQDTTERGALRGPEIRRTASPPRRRASQTARDGVCYNAPHAATPHAAALRDGEARRAVRRNVAEVEEVGSSAPLGHPARRIVEVLAPLVTPARLARFEAVLARRTRSLVPVLDGLSDPHNGAAILRSCDAFGCHEVHTVRGRFPFAISTHVSRHTERWLEMHAHESAEACAEGLAARGYRLFVAAMDGELTPEDLARVPRAAIVVGNEHRGVSEALRERASGVYRIPMVGFVESLNVSVATAITLYTATQGRHGDMSDDERSEALARFLLGQVKDGAQIVEQAVRSQGTS